MEGGRHGSVCVGEVLVLCRMEHVQAYTVTLSLLFLRAVSALTSAEGRRG